MVREVLESGRPLTYIRSSEEQRVEKVLSETARALFSAAPPSIWTWSLTEGLRRNDEAPQPGTESPRAALDCIAAWQNGPEEGPAIFHLKDFHEPMEQSAEVRRRLRDVYYNCLDQRKFIIITSPVKFIPEEIERNIMYLELRPPDLIELVEFLQKEVPHLSDDELSQLAPALQGLTLEESRYALRRATAGGRKLGADSLPALLEEKQLLVNRTGVIEFIPAARNLDEVGGLEGLKNWLTERRKLFLLRDTLSGEIVPKGVLIMGIPGCGKSLCVKAISSCFNLPLYRIDMIEIFSGRHGKPEGAFVQACKMMEDMAPAVLWFDEIEMGITSTESSGEQGRIFAFFLTWMQEKTRGLFIAATANRIDLLPAEMIRKGRFDEVFFVDLPLETEQTEIFRIHLIQRGVDISGFNLAQLTKVTIGWSGAEIEQCVISALTKARLADRAITDRDLVDIAVKIVPLSRTMKEQISKIRGWAFERAVRASPLPAR
jgi:SpoVK/Ycf46/Vps4 family AAA+-type ATPase